jgi:hypothetical protein
MVTARQLSAQPAAVNRKKERFRRLAAQRTEAILDRVRILGNCANPYQYEYTDEEVSKMFSTIERELKRVRALFIGQKRKKFSF